MRLSKIKLAGFKSFVDPTTIPLPSNLVGIVGPNGCGKSNVIDAVRWVMGESSAKNLRGESMTDVIFNGSTSRKPVGQASIELVFDNSDGTIGGQYANYNEISVKRAVSRDGQSNYFLNGSKCRRRDITDIFLGTGLGPRSYSIIEQGMISRLIEAKPEDLRTFLEEAAGISKYKERRRETENRIRHTRDNMDRLNDLRDELTKQLAHLERQSRTAEKYKEYKEQERLLKAQLLALRWQTLNENVTQREQQIAELETALEGEIAKQRGIESGTEEFREAHVEATEIFNEVQGRYYGIGGEIARTEQAIQHAKERRQQQQYDLQQAEKAWSEGQTHLESDQRRIEELNMQLMESEPALEINKERELHSAESLATAEQAMNEWQQTWDEFNQRAAAPSETAQVERTRVGHLEQTQGQLQQRMTRLDEERGNLSTERLESELEELMGQSETLAMDEGAREEQLQSHIEQINQQRDESNQLSSQLDETRSRLQSVKGRKASLEALQQAALGKSGGAVSEWLNKQGLAENQRLAQAIQVEGGWERAAECVLGSHLEAVCVENLDPVSTILDQLQHGSLSLLDKNSGDSGSHSLTTTLLSKINSSWSVDGLVAGIYAVDDLSAAMQLRGQLKGNESIVTKDGIWIGRNWLRVARDADEKAGVIHREQELKELTAELEELEEKAEQLQQQLEHAREALRHHEQEREVCQQGLKEVNRQHADVKAKVSGRQARMEQMRTRIDRIESEKAELQRQFSESEEEIKISRTKLHEALGSMEELAIQREELSSKREALRESLEQSRQQAKQDREEAHALSLRIQSVKTALESTGQSLERMQQQIEQLAERKETLQVSLAESDAPIQQQAAELETLLEQRSEVEAKLAEARAKVEEIDFNLRELDGQRNSIEHRAQAIRSEMEQYRMAWQELKVRRETVHEQLIEAGAELKALFENMPEEANEKAWAEQVNALEQRIQRLGPINLAAIEEYKTQSERKVYLDSQNEDLTAALETLESAIRKIDRETRTRFKETFDKVNTGLQELFPRLFGGGHAYLELTGEDLLDTGVTVMARPPGKRNSTIHLLSGGEKALTAVALVFSIFQLNPAPFCMLDEVDAPLDEANVGRFSRMVKEMSEHVQFIFITHNKTTMEISEQLNGVTMHEPGVSRLVAVNVTEAVEMAGIE